MRGSQGAGTGLYWGKVIGTLAGLATLKPALAVVGLFLGHQFDRGYQKRFNEQAREDARLGRVPEGFADALFATMGHLAKADGRVSEDEIRAARTIMHRMGMRPGQVRRAIDAFNGGKQPGFDLERTIREVRRTHARRPEMRTVFVRTLLEVALAKSRVDRRERASLWKICTGLDIGRVELAQLEAMVRAQKGFRRSPAGTADSERVMAAYRTLGVEQTAGNDEIKKAYRRQMNRNHPDKIAASNPAAAEVEAAQRKTREIRAAYELLKTRRTIR